jgi:hypothetical protein
MEVLVGIFSAWGRILAGYTPALSIEITRECPLHCPGCYAYGDDHLSGDVTLREVRDFKGQELIDGVLALADRQVSRLRHHSSGINLHGIHENRRASATLDASESLVDSREQAEPSATLAVREAEILSGFRA